MTDGRAACRLNYWRRASYIEALAAASAASVDFGGAIRYEEQAIKSGKLSEKELKTATSRLDRYKRHEAIAR